MMKKVLFGLSAILALFATSCQNELEQNVASGDTSTVTFEVAIPELATRAYSDGTTAKVLHYAVYDAKQKEGSDIVRHLDGLVPAQWPKFGENQLTTSIQLELVTGNTYKIAFWAAADGAPYEFDLDNATVNVKYDGAVSNDETRDAFFGSTGFTVEGKSSIDVTLRRPFAQLNIGTSDYAAAEAANFIPEKSKVVVRNIYGAFNLLSGEVDEETEAEVTFDYGTIDTTEEFPVGGYEYIAMNYLLVGTEKSVVDVEFSYWDEDYDAKTRSVGSVPVERNYRTNIYGKIFTSTTDLNVTIDPVYSGENNNEHLYHYEQGTYYFSSAKGLEFFAQKVNEGDAMWTKANVGLDADIDLGGAEWTPIGTSDKYFEGTFDGKGYTVSNFKVTEKEGHAGLFGNVRGRIKNLNVKDVVIEAKHYAGAIVGQGYAKIDNCNVENVNITLTTLNNDLGDKAGGIIGQNCEGANMYVKNSTAKNVTIKGYRDLGGIAGMAHRNNTVSGCSVENITIIQDLSDNYQTTIPVTLAGVVGRKGTNLVYENNVEKNVSIAMEVADAAGFAKAMTLDQKNICVVLANDIEVAISSFGQQTGGSGEYKLGGEATENILIDLNDKKLTIATTYWSVLGAKNENALFTIKNGTMTSSQASGTWNSYDLCFANCNYAFEDVVFEKAIALEAANKSYTLNDVTINETHDYYAIWVSAKGQNVTIDGLTVNSAGRGVKIDEQYVSAPAKVTMNVANATFNTAKKAAIVVKSVEGAEINWGAGNSIANVAADTEIAVWVDENSKDYADKVVVNGAFSKVEGVASVIVDTTDKLNAALANADVTNIYLAAGNYGTIVAKSNKAIIGSDNATVAAVNLNGVENFTVKNITFDAANAVLGYDGNGSAKQYANIITGDNTNKPTKGASNIVIDGCTFTGTFANGGTSIAFTDYKRISGFSGNVTIKNCTFDTENAYYNIYGYYAGNSNNFVIENNTFKTAFTQGLPVYLGRYASSVPVVVKGNTFETVASLSNAVYVQAHSANYTVSIDAANNTFAE